MEDDKTIQYSTNFTKNFKNTGKFSAEFQYEESDENEIADIILNNTINSEIVSTL